MTKSTILQAKNNTGVTLTAETVVYVSGFNKDGGISTIGIASNNSSSRMPALGIIIEDIINGESGAVKISGPIYGIDTSGHAINTEVYVGVNGSVAFTNPITSNSTAIIQKIGIVNTSDIEGLILFSVETESVHAIQHHTGGKDLIDHSLIRNLSADTHKQYGLANGSRAFTGVIGGITPVTSSHLATKGYVDRRDSGIYTTGQEHYSQHSDAIITIRKDLDGYLVVGETAVVDDLQVTGTDIYSDSTSGHLHIAGGTSGDGGQITLTGSTFNAPTWNSQAFYSALKHTFENYTGSPICMTIEGDTGDVGIGSAAPNTRLEVKDDTSTDYVAYFFNDGDNADRYGIKIRCGADNGSGTTNYLLAEDGDGTDTGRLKTVAGVFSLEDLSDETVKQDIAPTKLDCMSIINGIDVVEFKFKKNKILHPIGFTAQNCESVFPYMVGTFDSGVKGTTKSALIPVLVKAIQELTVRIEELENARN